jgi:hypothetical protein
MQSERFVEPQEGKKYPQYFNSFVYKYFNDFCVNNNIHCPDKTEITIKIIGAIFDSPYSCVSDFISDNINKSIKFMKGIASTLAVYYFKTWTEKRLELDIEKNQNLEIFPKMNLNSAFIISEGDELIPFDRYTSLVKSYGEKCVTLSKPPCVILKDRHSATRKHDMIQQLFQKFFEKLIEPKCFELKYVNLDYKKFIAEKAEKVAMPPAIQMYNRPESKSEINFGPKTETRNKSEIKKGITLVTGSGIDLYQNQGFMKSEKQMIPHRDFPDMTLSMPRHSERRPL